MFGHIVVRLTLVAASAFWALFRSYSPSFGAWHMVASYSTQAKAKQVPQACAGVYSRGKSCRLFLDCVTVLCFFRWCILIYP